MVMRALGPLSVSWLLFGAMLVGYVIHISFTSYRHVGWIRASLIILDKIAIQDIFKY